MSRLPIPHIINTIKTKLGFDRAMTAPGEDIVDAVNEQSQQIDNLQAAAAYVEDGDNATKKTYAEGEFIVWKGSLYTVNSGGIPLDTAITGHVTAVTGGGLNNLKTYVDDKFIMSTVHAQDVAYNLTYAIAKKNGFVKSLHVMFTSLPTTEIPPKEQYVTVGTIPIEYAPTGDAVREVYMFPDNNGAIVNMYQVIVNPNGTIQVYNYRNTRLSLEATILYQ